MRAVAQKAASVLLSNYNFNMLSRSRRLSTEQLDSVMKKGKISHSSLFLMRVFSGQTDTRIAAIAPKKTIKMSTTRNAVRRKVYNATKTLIREIIPGTHIALFAKQATTNAKLVDIENNIKTLFVKAGLLG